MEYYKLIKTKNVHIIEKPVIVDKPVESVVKNEMEVSVDNTSKIISEMRNLFEEFAESKNIQYDGPSKSTSLNDDQVNYILERLLFLEENVFVDIPLNHENISRDFIWNIPEEIYELYVDAMSGVEHPVMDPIVLFYIFCAESPRFAYGKFLQIVVKNLIDPNAQAAIDESADKWDGVYDDDDPEDSEESEEDAE